jgi:arylsulfatase A-like enzyme
MAELDRQVGRLLDALRRRPADRPTIVLFLSDNGPLPPFPGQKRTDGLRGSKLSLYEGGIRLPLIAWGPGLIPAGRADDATVIAAVDLFPTLCRIAGAPLPDGYAPDGEDRSAALRGDASPTRSRPLFWEYGRNGESFSYPSPRNRSPNVAVLDGDRKLLVNADGSGAELYDLTRDPRETTDRAVEEPELARRLTDAALAWRKALP